MKRLVVKMTKTGELFPNKMEKKAKKAVDKKIKYIFVATTMIISDLNK